MHCYTSGLGSSPVARHYWGNHCLFSLPAGTKMFQFPAFASVHEIQMTGLQPDGLSHSEIPGSKDICSYPRLIAAYHVLHRLREPRHPPDALTFFRHSRLTAAAHTFSCKLRVVIKHSVNNLKSLLTVLCVNMSKISIGFEISDLRLEVFKISNLNPQNSNRAVENNGFEPLTPCLQSRCSSQLS